MNPRVNKWLDLLDRAGWTALQAAAAALFVYITTDIDMGWAEAAAFVGFATLASILKVITGQNTGSDDTGSLIGQSVIEPPPLAEPDTPGEGP
jgi:TRAP-type C4-dicarboxylate transport system permease small subunit